MQRATCRSRSAAHAFASTRGAAPRRTPAAPRRRRSVAVRAEQGSLERLAYDRIVLALFDPNPYLSDGSRQAIGAAADLARIHKSKVTVLVVDQPGAEGGSPPDPAVKLQVINKSLHDAGCEGADILEKAMEAGGAVLVGDVADELAADLVLLSSEAVHTKAVDANQLAEFSPCAVLILS
ncbi:hypothetical protein HT031_000206 [Scenedesmus sp. PABB004]|nr:hypothetical protein HT031_000206 [Scenedesmus sp. PABB004]